MYAMRRKYAENPVTLLTVTLSAKKAIGTWVGQSFRCVTDFMIASPNNKVTSFYYSLPAVIC